MDQIIAGQSENYQKDLAALARMVTFARQAAQDLNISFPEYCLDLALAAVLDELKIAGVDISTVGKPELGYIHGYQ